MPVEPTPGAGVTAIALPLVLEWEGASGVAIGMQLAGPEVNYLVVPYNGEVPVWVAGSEIKRSHTTPHD
jgi:hypothetical protein